MTTLINRDRPAKGRVMLALLLGSIPLFGTVGGCPIGGTIMPITPTTQPQPEPEPEPPATQPGSELSTNQMPTLRFDAPFANISIQDSTPVHIHFTATDAEDRVRVNVLADFVDNSVDPPVEGTIVLLAGWVSDVGGGTDAILWNTVGIRPALYTIFGTVTDQVHPAITVVANGTVTILPTPLQVPPPLGG